MCEAGNTLIRVGDGFAVVAAIGTSLMMAMDVLRALNRIWSA
jgi:hypothetical protein